MAEPPSPQTLSDLVRRHAAERPGEIAVVEVGAHGRREVSWAELEQLVADSAAALDALGAWGGRRVLITASHTIDFVAAWFGALRSGCIAVPINPQLPLAEWRRAAAHSDAALALLDPPPGVPELTEADLPGVRLARLADFRQHAAGAQPPPLADPEHIAAIIYTAGTSADPKGAMLSHRALLAHCEHNAAQGATGPESVVLSALPLFHVYGLNAVLGAAIFTGARTVLVDGLPDDLVQILDAERISVLPLTPSALYRLSQAQGLTAAAGWLKLVTSGAAPLPAVLADHWQQLTGIRLDQGYGLTEAAPGVANTIGVEPRGPGHVGRAMPGVELRIGDPAEPAGAGPEEPGEIFIRGANLFSGYWPEGADAPDADGWFGTGDVGYLDGEDLFLVDRARDLVIVSGFSVFPVEVEEVLTEHPSVTDAAVIGQPDERTGERVVAFLVGERISTADVLAYAAERLARYKLPTEVLVLKKLPRSTTGKIRKGQLRDLLDATEEEER
ncbi:AMP-dependent synthetase [Enemella evansiae]|uniref:class I adenylate-forming enzyme family protein n=1 Tax=Enemella evansiae TaxID=2016499 RepID=UPI000B9715E5|nr:class I adenylate-forming enzyme family protein [Enemella evansiae]OYN97624.1 AMP-dependent synthetase [Enemella evansiae]